jgi:hypothetical protein
MKRLHPHGLRFVWHAVFPPLRWPRTRLKPAFQGMPADFIKGADISTLLDAEKHGEVLRPE